MESFYTKPTVATRMLAGGILGPILGGVFAYFLLGGAESWDIRAWLLTWGMTWMIFALIVVAATYYWRVTVAMLGKCLEWLAYAFEDFILSINLLLTPVGVLIAIGAIFISLLVGFGPYLLVFGGGIALMGGVLSLAGGADSGVLAGIIAILFIIFNVAWVAIVHIILPLKYR